MKHTRRIQKYLDGNMNKEELKKFQEDMQKDSEILEELDLHRSLGDVIVSKDEERFRKKLDEAYKSYKIDPPAENDLKTARPAFFSLKRIAVSLAILCIGFIVYFFAGIRKESNETIFNKYLIAYNKELISRFQPSAARESNDLEKGIALYQNRNYSEASQALSQFILQNPANTDAHFYKGLCNIYLNEFDSAISSFDFVLHQPYNYYKEYASWYQSMCYIRINKNDTARVILKEIADDAGYFSPMAKKVLKILK